MSKERTGMWRRRIGNVFITFGILLLLVALGLTAYNKWEDTRAAEASQSILEQLLPEIHQNAEERAEISVPDTLTEGVSDAKMPTLEIDRHLYIGTIEIPSAGIFLPVMAEWDYDKLKISPCRYAGSYYTDDLVICAHNYARHFSPIKWLDLGAEVYFTNVDGEMFQYTVSNIETVQPTAVEQMILNSNNSNSKNDWDLTLFTCNTGGQVRCAVRCEVKDGTN